MVTPKNVKDKIADSKLENYTITKNARAQERREAKLKKINKLVFILNRELKKGYKKMPLTDTVKSVGLDITWVSFIVAEDGHGIPILKKQKGGLYMWNERYTPGEVLNDKLLEGYIVEQKLKRANKELSKIPSHFKPIIRDENLCSESEMKRIVNLIYEETNNDSIVPKEVLIDNHDKEIVNAMIELTYLKEGRIKGFYMWNSKAPDGDDILLIMEQMEKNKPTKQKFVIDGVHEQIFNFIDAADNHRAKSAQIIEFFADKLGIKMEEWRLSAYIKKLKDEGLVFNAPEERGWHTTDKTAASLTRTTNLSVKTEAPAPASHTHGNPLLRRLMNEQLNELKSERDRIREKIENSPEWKRLQELEQGIEVGEKSLSMFHLFENKEPVNVPKQKPKHNKLKPISKGAEKKKARIKFILDLLGEHGPMGINDILGSYKKTPDNPFADLRERSSTCTTYAILLEMERDGKLKHEGIKYSIKK